MKTQAGIVAGLLLAATITTSSRVAPAEAAAPGKESPMVAPQSSASTAEDVARVRQRLRESLLPSPDYKVPASIEASLQSLRADGSWADQDYADTNREVWKAGQHMLRLVSIAKAHYLPGSSLAARPDVKEKLIAGLTYWLDKDPRNDNWWHNQIGVPQLVGELLILMGEDASPELRRRGAELMTRGKMDGMTGQNLVWTAQIQVMRGCIADDPALVTAAYERMWQEVRYAGKGEEGVQRDGSFHQHGPLLYSGGYGAGFTVDVARFASYALGTRYALPREKMAVLEASVLDGQQWMIRGAHWDHGVTGREFIRPGKNAAGMARPVATLAQIPSPRQKEMADFAARLRGEKSAPPLLGNRHYWLSDYMAHHRPRYFASTHMYSTRTANTDAVTNGENKRTHHVADGSLYLARDGNEYVGIYPVWDWRLFPGTTVEHPKEPLDPRRVRRMGATSFAGGVSDGTYGCAAMDLKYDALGAKKAWFYFDDQVVCLGAAISCPTGNPVRTSVNQCLLRGPVRTSAAPPSDLSRGERGLVAGAKAWVWHDGFAYLFPSPAGVHLRNDTQTGSLRDIGPGSPDPITKDVFSLWIDHGAGPQGGTYAYVVAPTDDAAQAASAAEKLPVEIVANTPELQAVWHRDLKMAQAVFYAPGRVTAGGITLSVDRPCLLLLRQDGDKVRLAVSNPENEAATVAVTVGGTRMSVELPGGLNAGKSVVREFSRAN